MSKLLIKESPMVFQRTLAKLIGLNEAIALQQIQYWLDINEQAGRNKHDGRYWTFNTIGAWIEQDFSFWSANTLRRTLTSLKKAGLLITGNYNKMQIDRTTWYTIDYDRLAEMEQEANMSTPFAQNEQMGTGIPQVTAAEALTTDAKVGNPTTQAGLSIYPERALHLPNMGKPLPETNTRDLHTKINRQRQRQEKPEPLPDSFVEETLELLNRKQVTEFIVRQNPYNRKLKLTLEQVLAANGQADNLRFYKSPDEAVAVSKIRDALIAASVPATPLTVAAVVIQGYSGAEEGGLGKSVVKYIHHAGCGLTLRPFDVYEGHGDSLIQETLKSTGIAALAEWLNINIINPTVELLIEQEAAHQHGLECIRKRNAREAAEWHPPKLELATA